MLGIWLILAAIAMLGLSGLPGCLFPARSAVGQRLAVLLMVLGSLTGLVGVGVALGAGAAPSWVLPWALPWGRLTVAVDALSALFLGPVFVIPALGSIYGLGYWPSAAHPENSRRLGLFYGTLAGAMALVVIARDGVLLLIAWEVMALSAFFAATVEEDSDQVRRAGWVYLIATHAGTLCLIALFTLWHRATGSLALAPAAIPAELAGVLLVLTVVGFGFKAGLMPLHVWLPGAHASAPSHVSAVMSGVMLKMGVYGMVRMTGLLPAGATWWGGGLLALGAVSGVAGIALALGQGDLKRLLAYSSIENIGIIAMGLGLALLGRSLARPDWVVLGLGGALLHMWNHSLFKPLLFFNAGAIIHATHTRDLDRLGGLAKLMPQTAALFAVGAVAICALPPLNGFAGEWLLYVGLFRTLDSGGGAGFPAAAVAAVALALIGALALACFVKLLGAVYLGTARGEAGAQGSDPGLSMSIPMIATAAGCITIGLFPWLAAPLLERAVGNWAALSGPQEFSISALVPLKWISVLGLALFGLVGALLLALRMSPRAAIRREAGTWDCGYAQPTRRMQYTGSSFGQMLVQLFALMLWPRQQWPVIRGLFSQRTRFEAFVPDVVLDRLVVPLFDLANRNLPRLRFLQQGQTHRYVLYILLVVILLFTWGAMGVQP